MDERKTIKKKKIMKKEIQEDLITWVGNDTDFEDEFDMMDTAGKGKLTFEEVANWIMMKNVKIEYQKYDNEIKN